MCDEVMAVIIDNLDMSSIGALSTVLNKKVKEVYDSRCRSCGPDSINKLGPNRKLRADMLKLNNYLCPRCLRESIDELEIRMLTLSYGLSMEEAEYIRNLIRRS